jgi:hypothetical protein
LDDSLYVILTKVSTITFFAKSEPLLIFKVIGQGHRVRFLGERIRHTLCVTLVEYIVLALFDKKETKNYPFLKTSFLCIMFLYPFATSLARG